MGLYIKGMKMPENCGKCMMRDGLFCMASDYKRISYGAMHRREEWCPLVELPEKHGDLIDRDAFRADYGMKDDCADCEKEMRGKVKACKHDCIYSKMDLCYWLDDADIVIEAEDGT